MTLPLCPACGGPLPRPGLTYCSTQCSAIYREEQKRLARGLPAKPPEAQGPVLMREIERLDREIKGFGEMLFGFQMDALRLLREIQERLSKREPSESKLASIKEAAKYLCICRQTLYRLIREGELRYVRIRGRVMFKKTELARYVERKERTYSSRRP